MSQLENEFFLKNESPKEIIDMNYDIFSNFIPTNY